MMRKYYLSQPAYNSPASSIDRENGIIFGITVAKIGPARGHEGRIDKTFLTQLVELANTRPQGIKARFGHPNICSSALGTYLGRFHNYSFQSDRVTADLHLDASAKDTPNGNLHEYILNMAENNPDMLGASIVFESADFEIVETEIDNKKSRIKNFRIKELRATDIVDDPAATDGLFSADTIAAQATQWLDQNPELTELIFSKPENLIEFLNNYLSNTDMKLSDKIKTNFRKLFSIELEEGIIDHMSSDTDTNDTNSSDDQLQTDIELIHTAFGSFVATFPEFGIVQNDDNTFSLQDGENTITFNASDMLETMLSTTQSLQQELIAAKSLINQLNDKLAARPTLPKQVTDPQVSTAVHQPENDETGKQILRSIPAEMRYRLRHLNQQPLKS